MQGISSVPSALVWRTWSTSGSESRLAVTRASGVVGARGRGGWIAARRGRISLGDVVGSVLAHGKIAHRREHLRAALGVPVGEDVVANLAAVGRAVHEETPLDRRVVG